MTLRPRIVCLVPLPPPATGQSVVTQTICAALAAHADVVVVDTADQAAVWRRPGTLPSARVRAWAVRLGEWRALVAPGPSRRGPAARVPAAVYLTPASSLLGLFRDAAALALVPAGVRVVAHIHVGDYGRLLGAPVWGALARRTLARFDRVFVPSAYAAAGIRAAAPGVRVEVVPNPVPADVQFTEDEAADARAARAGQTPHVLFLSNMIPSKGYGLLADALALLAAGGGAFRATFAGAWGSAPERAAFAARLAALGLADRTAVLGAVARADVRALLASADVLAFPSTYPHESFGLVVLEAMGAGVAVVAVRHAAAGELVRDGLDGRLVEATPAALALGLADALAHRDAYGASAAVRARGAFAPEPLTATFVAAILGDGILGEGARAASPIFRSPTDP